MRFLLMGPVEVWRDDRRVELRGAKITSVLALFLLARGRVVPDAALREMLWGERPPETAQKQIQIYVSRLRGLLGPGAKGSTGSGTDDGPDDEPGIERQRPGYRLRFPDAGLDLSAFERHVARGRLLMDERRPAEAVESFRRGLALWRGPALAGVSEHLAAAQAPQLEESRLVAVEDRIEAELMLGRHAALTPELQALVVTHPHRERPRTQLMLALHHGGRQVEALRTYSDYRALLVSDLGLEPGRRLQEVHQAILADDRRFLPDDGQFLPDGRRFPDGLLLPGHRPPDDRRLPPGNVRILRAATGTPSGPARPAGPGRPSGPGPVDDPGRATGPRRAAGPLLRLLPPPSEPQPPAGQPAQLPPVPMDFTGREREARQVDEALRTRSGQRGAPSVCAIVGMAGSGKSVLAARVAHRIRDGYPDGQIHLDLGGSGPRPVSPADALTELLRALGVADVAGGGLSELTRVYRSRVAGRRLLILLDDARDERQVRPLLPATAESGVLVTSRSGLAALEGVRHVRLGTFGPEEAVRLLSRLIGSERVAAEPAAAARIVALGGHLPLAVRISGARLALRPHWPLARLAARLADSGALLDELELGDLGVRRSLSVSHSRLGDGERRALHRLARLGPGPFSLDRAATQLGTSGEEALDVLDHLIDAHLLDAVEQAPARYRYRFHPLVRALARESADERRSVVPPGRPRVGAPAVRDGG
ncbi:BTAD domain-containing putative transcriptional regulator [Kitasatospora sp. NPDC056446]|uniref:AfsR/SARP family transcriptional regulator n=1 Tax=Kitasatospora sp. NPDC056446 TaxID=3345819 RepID=UPI0036738045